MKIRSGHFALHRLLVGNHGHRELQIETSGELITTVVDPASGQLVGGYAGAIKAMLMTFTVAPGATERIPLLAGTRVSCLSWAMPFRRASGASRPSWGRPPGLRSARRS